MKTKSKILDIQSLPGVREITLDLQINDKAESLTLSKEDAYLLLTRIFKIQVESWEYPGGPLDKDRGESKPDLLFLVDLKN